MYLTHAMPHDPNGSPNSNSARPTSAQPTSPHLTPPNLNWPHLISPQFTPHHITTAHLTAAQLPSHPCSSPILAMPRLNSIPLHSELRDGKSSKSGFHPRHKTRETNPGVHYDVLQENMNIRKKHGVPSSHVPWPRLRQRCFTCFYRTLPLLPCPQATPQNICQGWQPIQDGGSCAPGG